MEFDYTIIEEKFKQLPAQTQLALSSTEIVDTIREIGQKHGLRIDQESTLLDQTTYAILGLVPGSDFAKNFSKETGVGEADAKSIAEEINMEVFAKIKLPVTKVESSETINSSLEQAGGFEIEPDMPVNGEEERANPNIRGFSAFSSGDASDTLAGIEDPTPTPAAQTMERKIYNPAPIIPTKNPMTEPLVDQLLRGSSSTPEKKIDVPTSAPELRKIPPIATPVTPQPPRNLPTNDPYREAMK